MDNIVAQNRQIVAQHLLEMRGLLDDLENFVAHNENPGTAQSMMAGQKVRQIEMLTEGLYSKILDYILSFDQLAQ